MKKFLFCLPALCCFIYYSNAQSKTTHIDKLMHQYAANGQFNGVVLVAEKGKIIYQKAFGIADFEWNLKSSLDAKFEIASITKTFTALMVMRLWEQGLISLDGKISDYLKDYPSGNGSKISIRQLLTHSSG